MSDELQADVVLEGGGVKGIALVGALSVLIDAGYTFPRVAGTSAGAIVGALLAADTSAEQMRSIMAALDYRRFQDESWLDALPGGKIISLLVDDGIYEGEYLKAWLDEVLGDVDLFEHLALPDDPDSALPQDWPYAAYRTLTRPIITEAPSFAELLPAVEMTALLFVGVLSWRRLANAPKLILTTPYLMFAALCLVTFGVAFASSSNLGLLVRQRTLVIPFLLLFLCIPPIGTKVTRAGSDELEVEDRSKV